MPATSDLVVKLEQSMESGRVVYYLDSIRWSGSREYTIPMGSRGSGLFANVYDLGRGLVLKVVYLTKSPSEKLDADARPKTPPDKFEAEARIHEALSTLTDPPVCPRLVAWGIPKYVSDATTDITYPPMGVLVMQSATGTARDYLTETKSEDAILDYYTQVATILTRLEPYKFNHRDLKSDNILYVMEDDKPVFLLADFGHACATIDGTELSGQLEVEETTGGCFRKSRDLAQLVFDSRRFLPEGSRIERFAQSLLVIGPGFPGRWEETYDYFDNKDIETPKTVPEKFLKAIADYRSDPEGFLAAASKPKRVRRPRTRRPKRRRKHTKRRRR